jgi:hypothetical protein
MENQELEKAGFTVSEDGKSITITLDYLMKTRNNDLANERRAIEYLKQENHPQVKAMYEHDRCKSMGMKESNDAWIRRITGSFPDDDAEFAKMSKG